MAKFLNGDGLSRLVALTKQALSGKQDTLVSGTNIKTINNTSLLSSGNLDLTKKVEYFTKADMDADTSQPNGTIGYDGDNEVWYIFDQPNGEWKRIDIQNPNEIASITTSESSVSGGNNSVTITETNGTTHTFNVKNGVDGANGVSLGDVEIADNMTTDDATKVLSARQGKMIGDDLSRLRDYEFGTRTYTDSDLLKDKCTTTNTNPIDGIIRPQPDCGAMKFPITKGDKLTIATNGGSGARAYCLTDTSGTNPVLVSASNLNTTSNPVTIDVEQDGYCYINCKSASYEDFSIVHYYSLERQMLEDNTRSLTQGEMQGTSQWIRDKLVGLGWEFEMYLKSNGTTAVFSGHCVTPFIELPSSVAGHNLTFGFMFVGNSSCSIAFYNSSKAFTSGHYIGTNGYTDTRTVDINSGWTADAYVRMTCNPSRLSECYIYDNTTEEYIWKGDEYLSAIYEDNLVSYKTFRDVFLTQEYGNNKVKVVSQNTLTEELRESITIGYSEFAWHIGGINDTTGASEEVDSVCRSRYIEIPTDCNIITFSLKEAYNVYVYLYDKDKVFLESLGAVNKATINILKEDYPTAAYIRFKGTSAPTYVHQREYINVSLTFKNGKKKTERNVLVAKGLDQHDIVYFKLNKNQVNLINSSDVISVLWVVGSGQDRNDYNRYFMPFYSSDTDTLRIGHSSGGAISKVNSTSAGNTNIAGTERHGVCGLAVNRKTGEVKYYDRGRYVTTFTDSSFVLSKFISNDGVFYINNASTNGAYFSILYNLSLYIGDIFELLINSSDWLSMLNSIDGAHLCFAGLNKYSEIGRLNSYRQPITYGMLGTKSGTTYTVSTLPASTSKFTFASYSQPPYLRKYIKYLQITQGVARFPALTDSNATQKLYNSNSSWEKLSEVSDYENVGVGYYILEDYGGNDLKRAGGDMRVVEVPFVVDVAGGHSIEQPWGCVANFKFDTTIDDKIYDEVTNQYYTAYSDAACKTPTSINLSSVPFKKYCLFNKSTPTFVGELKIYNGKIYIAQDMTTWKQINNS